MIHKAWCCLEEVPYCFERSSVKFQGHTAKKKSADFDPNWAFPDCDLSFNLPMTSKWCTNLKQHKRGALLFFKIILQISRSHETKKTSILTQNGRFRTVIPVRIHWWLWNDAQNLKQYRRGALLFFKVICQISRSHGTKKSPIVTRIERFQTVT